MIQIRAKTAWRARNSALRPIGLDSGTGRASHGRIVSAATRKGSIAVSAVKRWASGALAGTALLVAAGAAAQGDPEQGRALADAWCASCHLVAPGGTASDAAPPFPMIANYPGMTQQRLRGWLVAPHPPMPDFNLTRAEIDAIIAYLETLRRQ